jgi:hypothetical protein
MTDCNFRDAHLIGIDFYNCNMRNVSFKNTTFANVIFYNCNLKNADFNGVKFSNVVIICTKLSDIKNFDEDAYGVTIMRSYPKLCINELTELNLLKLAKNGTIYKAKVLHVNKVKLNHWSLSIVESRCGVGSLDFLAKVLNKKEKWYNLHTVYSYISLIENLKNNDKIVMSCSGTLASIRGGMSMISNILTVLSFLVLLLSSVIDCNFLSRLLGVSSI